MTALLPTSPPSPEVVWRRLRPRLWVGRAADEHIGMIERGRRFTATGLHGETRGGYRTLEAAQAALTGEVPVVAAAPALQVARPALVLASTAAMLVAVPLSIAGLALLR